MLIVIKLGIILLDCICTLWRQATSTAVSNSSQIQEFCQNEVFSVQCSPDSVVYVNSADYGRMRIGRCVRKDYGFVGCSQSVVGIADSFCGGRRACNIPVPNQYLDAAVEAHCPEDFKYFLQVRYECLKVVHVTKPSCRSEHVRTEPQGVIASVVTMETDCGSDQMPWRIELLPGQRINVTLHDFVYSSRETPLRQPPGGDVISGAKCVAYAIFKDLVTGGPSQTLCGGRERVSTAYVSKSEKLQIVILKRSEMETYRYFLLKYVAIGCGYPVAPSGGWAMRVHDEAIFGCNFSSSSWKLRCQDSRWTGTAYNCTIPENTLGLTGVSFSQSLTFEIAVGAVVFIALVIASLILCIGVLLIRRYGKNSKPLLEMIPAGTVLYDIDGGSDCMTTRPTDLDRDSDQIRDTNDYAYIDTNQQIHGLLPPPCRHGTLVAPLAAFGENSSVGGQFEGTGRENPLPSRTPTPYSTLERNTDSGMSSIVDWKVDSSPTRLERRITNPTLRTDWSAVHSFNDSVLLNSESPSRRPSYQIKTLIK